MRLPAALALLCCIFAAAAFAAPALAADSGATPKTAVKIAAAAAQPKAADATTITERVLALEKENLVLREDLGRARLDLKTSLNEQAKRHADEMARMQLKVDELNSQLTADREKQSERNRTLWIAIGVLTIGMLAAN